MSSLLPMLGTLRDLLLVVLGFSLIIVVHELGHFLAARWAGVRVLAFAVGFGPSLISYRKGFGLRRGSSEGEYNRRRREDRTLADSRDISPTEYRLNALPFGGYVKMLGQDDTDPGARSDEPDSFQLCPVWKRMVIISAGVVMNVLLAAALFIVVFMVGLRTEPPVIGSVQPGSPAAAAVAVNAIDAGLTEPGLQAGDRVVSIDGEPPVKFMDLVHASAMARRGRPIQLVVERPGTESQLKFDIVPEVDEASRLQMLGIAPAVANALQAPTTGEARREFDRQKAMLGLPMLEPGSRLVRLDGREVRSAHDLTAAAKGSNGATMAATFERPDGGTVEMRLTPRPALMLSLFRLGEDLAPVEHLLGLTPVLRVTDVEPGSGGDRAGLKPGDIFSLLGAREWPSYVDGIAQIRAHKGREIRVSVMRQGGDGGWREIDLGEVPVDRKGQIGFRAGDSAGYAAWVSGWPRADLEDPKQPIPSGAALQLIAGSRITSVNGESVSTLHELREALRRSTRSAAAESSIELEVELPGGAGSTPRRETVRWTIPPAEIADLQKLAWTSPIPEGLFEPEMTVLKASGPIDAIGMGLRETHSVMLQTYLTFARLFQGSVKVTHLKGPVGIAHVGTLLAGRGWVWLVFFMALISVNLAVINFLPIPIADGGHMVFLVYEQITGKPVSPMVQNISALVGLAMLASIFLVVTFNDLRTLFTG